MMPQSQSYIRNQCMVHLKFKQCYMSISQLKKRKGNTHTIPGPLVGLLLILVFPKRRELKENLVTEGNFCFLAFDSVYHSSAVTP